MKGKTNFEQYRKALGIFPSNVRSKCRAIFSTWTGKIMQELGFGRILEIEEDGRDYSPNEIMTVVFGKGDTPTEETLEDFVN